MKGRRRWSPAFFVRSHFQMATADMELDERGITTPADVGEALGMPAAEATSLLTRHQWREGDVALLEAATARLGVQVLAMTGT
jgi:hypothetical protein